MGYFEDKYTNKAEAGKTNISDDAFAQCDMINNLIKALERLPR